VQMNRSNVRQRLGGENVASGISVVATEDVAAGRRMISGMKSSRAAAVAMSRMALPGDRALECLHAARL
jgi:hypothetical protein